MLIRKIDPVSAGKVIGVIYAIIGLIMGIIVSISTIFIRTTMWSSFFYNRMMPSAGIFAFILYPILYGIFGFISAAIFAIIYNIVVTWVGPLDIETK